MRLERGQWIIQAIRRTAQRWLIVQLVTVVLAGGACNSRTSTSYERIGTTGPTAPAPAPRGLERIAVRNVTLPPGETVSIGFHPTSRRAELVVTPPSSKLRACPGDGMANLATGPDASSWGSTWPAGDCRKLSSDGRLRLPGYSEHLSVIIVNQSLSEVPDKDVRLVYDQQDFLKFVRLPTLSPEATSPEVLAPLELLDNALVADGSGIWESDQRARLELVDRTGEVLRSDDGVGGTAVSFLDIGRSAQKGERLALRIVNLSETPMAPTIYIEVSCGRPLVRGVCGPPNGVDADAHAFNRVPPADRHRRAASKALRTSGLPLPGADDGTRTRDRHLGNPDEPNR